MADDHVLFVYMGGDQRVPRDVRYVRVHKSVKIITLRAFSNCFNLVSIEMHDGVEIIEQEAFSYCYSLSIQLLGVRVIGKYAFHNCFALTDVEFGDKLETIGYEAFYSCTSLRTIKIPKIRVIGEGAFAECVQLTEVELSEDLETVGEEALAYCPRLRRISIPLKDNLLGEDVFYECNNLSQIDLVGGIHKTVSSLALDSWRREMNHEIDRINQVLPNTRTYEKTIVIQQWMETVIRMIEDYKNEHYILLKECTTLLELALWRAKLDQEFGEAYHENESKTANKAKIDVKAARQERRITSGASIVIKNVLPFLKLE